MNIQELNQLIKKRRAVFPSAYNREEVTDQEIGSILENASWAPTHKMTEPWRFVVFKEGGLHRLSEELSRLYLEITPVEKRSEQKIKKTKRKMETSSAVIAIILDAHPDLLPEWEEIASVAMAVQNMWLSCTAMNIGCYWSSPKTCEHLSAFLELDKSQKCIGLFYLGKYDLDHEMNPRKRTPISEKVKWEV